MSAIQTTDIATAVDFLKRRFEPIHTGYVVLGFIKDGVTTHEYIGLQAPDRWERARLIIERYADAHDCYVAAAVFKETKRRNPTTDKNEYRTTDMIAFVTALYLERDDNPYPDAFPPSSYTVETSDGNYQDYFDLDKAIDAETAGRYLRRLAAGAGLGNQAVDAARLLRLPGTVNRKPIRNGEIVTVVTDTSAVYRLADFDHLPDVQPNPGPRHTTTGDGIIPNGQRNSTLASLAGTMRRRGMSAPALLAALVEENTARCVPPLDDDEVRRIAESVGRYTPAEPVTRMYEPTPIRPEAESIAPSRTTDVANAERFARQHGDRLRFCHPFNKWVANDNRRWALDNVAEVERCGKETARSIYREAAEEQTDMLRIELGKHAIRSESEARIRAMISLGKSEPGIPVLPEALDADPWLFNLLNGTINLKTGTLQPHNRADLITKLAPVVYDPAATAPTFDAFLARILPSESLRQFVQRAAGYSLTGDTREDVLLIAYGNGHNGKTTLLQTLQALMGDYAIQTRPETLMIKHTEGIPNDIAALKGARLVAASEAEEGKRLAESLIKQLTGGDRISARFLHGEFFEFDPAFKIWLSTNHKPIIRGTDRGIWRRIRLIPFDVTIPDDECDETLPEKLRGELPGILNWVLAGCRDWLENSLGMPDEVKQATQAYRDEMDIIGNWLTECCVEHRHASASVKQLYASYLRWCEGNGEKPESQNKLGARLTERGYTRKPMRDGVHWLGIGLGTSPDQNPPECEPCEPCEPNSEVKPRERVFLSKTPKIGSQGSQGSHPAQTSVFSLTERDIPADPEQIAWGWIVAVKAEREFGIPDTVLAAAVRLGCALDRFASAEDEAARLADYLDRHTAMKGGR